MTGATRAEGEPNTPNAAPRRPPYRIRTARLLLRPYAPVDAPALQAALARNKEHLEPWLPFAAREPATIDEKVETILRFRAGFDRCEDFVYGAFDPMSGVLVGSTGLHLRVGPAAGEIGYWMDADRCGAGLAREAACAMVRIGFEDLGFDRIEIRCDPLNVASGRIPLRLGFQEDGTLRGRLTMPDGTKRDARVFSLFAEEYCFGPLRHTPLERWDALDRRIESTAPTPPHSPTTETK